MGQIKNIKLHIVTDIKTELSAPVHTSPREQSCLQLLMPQQMGRQQMVRRKTFSRSPFSAGFWEPVKPLSSNTSSKPKKPEGDDGDEDEEEEERPPPRGEVEHHLRLTQVCLGR